MRIKRRGAAKSQWEKIPLDKDLVENSIKLAERDTKTSRDAFNNKDYD